MLVYRLEQIGTGKGPFNWRDSRRIRDHISMEIEISAREHEHPGSTLEQTVVCRELELNHAKYAFTTIPEFNRVFGNLIPLLLTPELEFCILVVDINLREEGYFKNKGQILYELELENVVETITTEEEWHAYYKRSA